MASLNLEVGIDAAGVVKGSREAFQALVQLTNATRHLMDGLEAMNGTSGAMGRFGALVSRFSPHLMAATAAMSAASLALNVFSGKTSEAADAQKRLAEEIAAARREQELARSLGESTLPGAQAERSAVRKALGSIGGPVSLGAFATANEVPQQNLLRWLATRGDEEAAAALRGERILRERSGGGMNPSVRYDTISPADLQLSPDQQKALLEAKYRVTGYNVEAAGGGLPSRADMSSWGMYPGSLTSRGPVGQPVGMGLNFPRIDSEARARNWSEGWNGVSQSENDQFAVSAENQRAAQQEQLRVMQETERSAQMVGQYLGDAATRFVTGMATARELAASLATDLLRAGLSQAFTAGARGILGSFNSTPAQRVPGEG